MMTGPLKASLVAGREAEFSGISAEWIRGLRLAAGSLCCVEEEDSFLLFLPENTVSRGPGRESQSHLGWKTLVFIYGSDLWRVRPIGRNWSMCKLAD